MSYYPKFQEQTTVEYNSYIKIWVYYAIKLIYKIISVEKSSPKGSVPKSSDIEQLTRIKRIEMFLLALM